jgi:elongation factor P--beta-lysine ligase
MKEFTFNVLELYILHVVSGAELFLRYLEITTLRWAEKHLTDITEETVRSTVNNLETRGFINEVSIRDDTTQEVYFYLRRTKLERLL